MGRDTVQLETAVSTISQEYLLEFTSEYSISEGLHPELPGRGGRIVDFPEGKVGVYTKFFKFANFRIPISQFLFDILGHYQIHLSQLSVIGAAKIFWVDEKVFLTVMDWRISAPKDGMPVEGTYSVEDVELLNTRRTPIQRQPEFLLCLIGLSRRYFLGDDVYPTFLYDDGREMDLFNLFSTPNPATVKTSTRPRAAHEVPLLTTTTSRVIDMEDVVATSTSSGTPSAMEKSSKGATVAGDPESKKSSSFTSFAGSPCGIYQPGCGITNSCRLDTPGVCQDAVDHMVPPGFEQEVRLLKKAKEKVAKRDQRIQAREEEIKKLDQEIRSLRVVDTEVLGLRNQTRNLETLLEVEVDMKKHEDDKVEKRCAEMDARLDALSIDFDEELYPHMLTAIASRRWVIGHGLSLAVMKCAESTKLRQVFADVVSAGIAKGMSEGLKYRSDGIPVLVPTVAPQGLAILLTDDATQTETTEDEASPRLIRSKSMPPMYNLDWP
ncbi:hypothetical protein Tco_0643657 [Tanacetum coccineum]